MKLADYMAHDALGLAALIRGGEVTALEVTDAAIAAIEQLDPSLNAVVMTAFDEARAAAGTVDRAAPLAGVPFLAKDTNIHVGGFRTTHSCRFYADSPMREDSELARRWRKAGLVILGKTNTPELAAEFVTEPAWRGATRNPLDLARTPGGSSGGAGAAVVAGMVPLAHATDAGGSLRVPASACGLFGLKPSRGLVPVGPEQGEIAGGLNCDHVLSRSVRDSAAMLDATAGFEAGAPYLVPARSEPWLNEVGRCPGRLRIGFTVMTASGGTADAVVTEGFLRAVETMQGLGHELVPWTWPEKLDVEAPAAVLYCVMMAEELQRRADEAGREPLPGELEAQTWHALRYANNLSAVDYARARRAANLAGRRVAAAMAGFDLVMTPTTASLPPVIGTIPSGDRFEPTAWTHAVMAWAPFTEVFNLTGQPALSAPLVRAPGGLPIGIQFAAAMGNDALLLRLAGALELELAGERPH